MESCTESDSGLYFLFRPKLSELGSILLKLDEAYKKIHANGKEDKPACGTTDAREEIFYFTVWKVPLEVLEEVCENCQAYETFKDYFELEEYIIALLSETESNARERAHISELRRAQHGFH